MSERELAVTVYLAGGSTHRFDRCWNVTETDVSLDFSYKELETTHFATFQMHALAGWSVESA